MTEEKKPVEELLSSLQERAKELSCLYRVEEVLSRKEVTTDFVFNAIIQALPAGWQYPDICRAEISLNDRKFRPDDFKESPWFLESEIVVEGKKTGTLRVYYLEERPASAEGPFLREERKLIDTIAERIGVFLFHQKMKEVMDDLHNVKKELANPASEEWRIVLDLISRTDEDLYLRLSRKMLYHLCWSGVDDAIAVLQRLGDPKGHNPSESIDENRPLRRRALDNSRIMGDQIFTMASGILPPEDILSQIRKWMQEEKSVFLVQALENLDTSLDEIAEAIRRFHHQAPEQALLPPYTVRAVNVALIHRFFTDQLDFVRIAKDYVNVEDFYEIIQRMVHPPGSHGKLGGKSAGMFIARQMLKKHQQELGEKMYFKTPKTWYITSDGSLNFLHHNKLEEVFEQKYKDIDQIREEYPYIVQVFKNSEFSTEIIAQLSVALDDFEERPIIVRSSSLLEDRLGSAFSGKYKSLFLANQGPKKQRLDALLDAIAEVYASIFSPDPIEYRSEKGLLDFHEEMGIMIQEVVGTQVGKYFLPAYAGVAFSNNEFRWSPRIRREDGLIRLVPGLGTRAVDRLSDDYPVLIAPGQPGLRVNVTPEEVVRYSPRKIDLINLETNDFDTMEVDEFLKIAGSRFPGIAQMVSLIKDRHIYKPTSNFVDPSKDDLVITFEGLVSDTPFVTQIHRALTVLQERMGHPVDIEFVCDGKDVYLLQCRAQSDSDVNKPAEIPKDIPPEDAIFSAKRFVSNGWVPEASHIVYIDPDGYNTLDNLEDMRAVGKAVGKLNQLLPKRGFILMGPGRWGSRGDIRLGVNVTYSDINNTSVLIEIARKKGNYTPDLSFGTHFFQDLVEASIRYLPLYPDESDVVFNEEFLKKSHNILPEILPQFQHLANTIFVIDLSRETENLILRVLMNAETQEAVGFLSPPGPEPEPKQQRKKVSDKSAREDHWRWRYRMAKRIASELDADHFGVKGLYLFGSTKNATAGAGSDIDLLIHDGGDLEKRQALKLWLEGWSLSLSEINFLRTGERTDTLLDVHFVTDVDVAKKSSYAVKIGAVTDPAAPLALRRKNRPNLDNPDE